MGERKPSNSALGEARLSFLPPAAIEILRKNLREKLYPMLQSRYGADKDLTLYDGLILGSVAPSVSQPVHRDASLITINIPLSPQEALTGLLGASPSTLRPWSPHGHHHHRRWAHSPHRNQGRA